MDEYGRVYSIETRIAGAVLDGDHTAEAATLNVAYGWDFDEDGGTCQLGDTELTYTSATFPPEDDDDVPVILHLADPLGFDTIDGDFVKVLPGGEDKVATVEITGQGVPVVATVRHDLVPYLPDGIRGDESEAETVVVTQDTFGSWTVVDVPAKQPQLDGSYLDPDGPTLPPQLIPGEGWDYMGPIAPENIVTGTLQSKVQIGEEIWVTRYADPTDPDSPTDPDAGIISITPDDGLRLRIPNQDDPEAEPTTLVHLPVKLYDDSGQRVTATFQGRADFSAATALQFRAVGNAADGDVSMIGTSAELQLNNAVADPTAEPTVTFGPQTRNWSNTSSDYIENGWGTSGSNVVFAVRKTGGGGTRFRFLNPASGLLDHDVQCQVSPPHIASMTVCDSHIYVVFRGLGEWALGRFDLNGQIYGNGANLTSWVNGGGQVCVGTVNGRPTVAYRDQNNRIRIRQYYNGFSGLLRAPDTWATDHYDSPGRVLSGLVADDSGTAYLFSGSRVVQLDNLRTPNEAGSFWSGIGSVSGGGYFPDGRLAAFDGQGTCAVYNDDPAVQLDQTVAFATTLANTTTGNETGLSPVVTRAWTAKAFAAVQADRLVPGTNQVRFYGSTTGTTHSDMVRLGEASSSVVIGPLARMPATGARPPAQSQFTSAGEIPGKVVSQALIPGTTRRAASVDAQGNAELHGLTQPWVSRKNEAGQALPSGSWVVAVWPTADETHADIAYSAGTFTVRHSGVYEMSAQATVTGFSDNTRFACRIIRNGAIAARLGQHATGSTFCTTGIYGFKVRLNVGDRIAFELNQNSGTLQTTNAEVGVNWITLTRLGI